MHADFHACENISKLDYTDSFMKAWPCSKDASIVLEDGRRWMVGQADRSRAFDWGLVYTWNWSWIEAQFFSLQIFLCKIKLNYAIILILFLGKYYAEALSPIASFIY